MSLVNVLRGIDSEAGTARLKRRTCLKVGTDVLVCPPFKPFVTLLSFLEEAGWGFRLLVFWRTAEGVCPYFVALSLIKGTLFSCREGRSFDARRASLRCEETPSLSADDTVHSPLHSERGRGRGSREGGGEAPYNLLSTHLRAFTNASIHGVISSFRRSRG